MCTVRRLDAMNGAFSPSKPHSGTHLHISFRPCVCVLCPSMSQVFRQEESHGGRSSFLRGGDNSWVGVSAFERWASAVYIFIFTAENTAVIFYHRNSSLARCSLIFVTGGGAG